MSAQELNNETFPGIEAVNGFYTAYYMQEYFPAAVGNAIAQWKDLPAEERPESQVKAQRAAYANIINGEDDLLTASTVHDYCDGLLTALGYDMQANKPTIVTDPQTGAEIPVHLQLRNAKGSPQLCVLISTQTDAQSGILERYGRCFLTDMRGSGTSVARQYRRTASLGACTRTASGRAD